MTTQNYDCTIPHVLTSDSPADNGLCWKSSVPHHHGAFGFLGEEWRCQYDFPESAPNSKQQ